MVDEQNGRWRALDVIWGRKQVGLTFVWEKFCKNIPSGRRQGYLYSIMATIKTEVRDALREEAWLLKEHKWQMYFSKEGSWFPFFLPIQTNTYMLILLLSYLSFLIYFLIVPYLLILSSPFLHVYKLVVLKYSDKSTPCIFINRISRWYKQGVFLIVVQHLYELYPKTLKK